jgi:hypothetical protein
MTGERQKQDPQVTKLLTERLVGMGTSRQSAEAVALGINTFFDKYISASRFSPIGTVGVTTQMEQGRPGVELCLFWSSESQVDPIARAINMRHWNARLEDVMTGDYSAGIDVKLIYRDSPVGISPEDWAKKIAQDRRSTFIGILDRNYGMNKGFSGQIQTDQSMAVGFSTTMLAAP